MLAGFASIVRHDPEHVTDMHFALECNSRHCCDCFACCDLHFGLLQSNELEASNDTLTHCVTLIDSDISETREILTASRTQTLHTRTLSEQLSQELMMLQRVCCLDGSPLSPANADKCTLFACRMKFVTINRGWACHCICACTACSQSVLDQCKQCGIGILPVLFSFVWKIHHCILCWHAHTVQLSAYVCHTKDCVMMQAMMQS